jgi:microcystin degradation protein MlrC
MSTLAAVTMASCVHASQARSLRIAISQFQHEATTFLSEKVDIDGFRKPNLSGRALLDSPAPDIRAFLRSAREHAGVQFVPLESHGELLGGSSKGWMTREAFEYYAGLMIRDLSAGAPIDAVYLSLHGAAAVEGVPRPEAELARRIRATVGPNVPIAATFDLHGNEDEAFLRHADFSLACKYFPHYDSGLQGERAARLLIRAARGEYKATTATRKPGIITPTVMQWTGEYPWANIAQRALIWEAREPDAYVSFFFGYPWSDVPDVGATFQVMTNNNQALADRIADDMSAYMWRVREDLMRTPVIAPGDAVARARMAAEEGRTPIVLADYSDRGGDATHILAEIIRQDLSGVLYATLRDERTLATLKAAGAKAGDAFDLRVGGFAVVPASGSPVRVQGRLVYFGIPPVGESGDLFGGEVAILEFGRGNCLMITPQLVQITDPEEVAWAPVDPDRFTTWILKSRVHFRAGFDDTGYAKTIMIVDAPEPFLGTLHLEKLPYRNVDLKSLYPYGRAPNAR